MIVKAKNFPVRYEGKTYPIDEEFKIKKEHFKESIFELIDEGEEDNDILFSKLTKEEIKEKLKELGIEYDPNAKKDELLKVLEEAPTE